MVNLDSFKSRLILEEGFKLFPYPDTEGQLTIGVGRNLTANGISQDEAAFMLEHDVVKVFNSCYKAFAWFHFLDDVRQEVILDMCFNLGIGGLLTFKKMLVSVENKDYELAAVEMLQSKWASQVHDRAIKLAEMMRTGTK